MWTLWRVRLCIVTLQTATSVRIVNLWFTQCLEQKMVESTGRYSYHLLPIDPFVWLLLTVFVTWRIWYSGKQFWQSKYGLPTRPCCQYCLTMYNEMCTLSPGVLSTRGSSLYWLCWQPFWNTKQPEDVLIISYISIEWPTEQPTTTISLLLPTYQCDIRRFNIATHTFHQILFELHKTLENFPINHHSAWWVHHVLESDLVTS